MPPVKSFSSVAVRIRIESSSIRTPEAIRDSPDEWLMYTNLPLRSMKQDV